MKEFVLNNGLKLLFHPMPNTHSVTVGLYIKAGSAYGDESIPGITHLLEHLHFRHCGKYTQKELYYKMESIGSTLKGSTYHDLLEFYMKISPIYINECLDIFKNLILSDEWSDEEFQKEKNVVKNQIYEESDYLDIDSQCRNIVFKGHPLSGEIMGSVEDIDEITIDNIKKYKNEIFNTSDMLLCITGNLDESMLLNAVSEIGNIELPRSEKKKTIAIPKRFSKRNPDVKFIGDINWDLLEVKIAFDVPADKYEGDMIEILNCILGEGVGSRLQVIVREEKSYTSNIYSYVGWCNNIAVVYIGFMVNKKNLIDCCEAIGKILNDLKVEITKKDLDISLPFFTVNTQFYEDDTADMNKLLAHHLMTHNKHYTPSTVKNNNETITILQDMAKYIFKKENMSLVIAGKLGKITQKSITNAIFK